MDTKLYLNHAFHTKDESLWVEFAGHVPRQGEIVRFIGNPNDYRVQKVLWFAEKCDDGTISSARVIVEPITSIR